LETPESSKQFSFIPHFSCQYLFKGDKCNFGKCFLYANQPFTPCCNFCPRAEQCENVCYKFIETFVNYKLKEVKRLNPNYAYSESELTFLCKIPESMKVDFFRVLASKVPNKMRKGKMYYLIKELKL